MAEESLFRFEKVINVSGDQIYRAFTSATGLREWLCDIATTNPVKGGRIFMAWERGYFASGTFTNLIPDKLVSFSWIGRAEPAWTQVDIEIVDLGTEGTRVVLEHSGIGEGELWQNAREEIRKGWEDGLKNLKSIMEDGRDLRVTDRPLIGIYAEDLALLTKQRKESLNNPVIEGALVTDIVPEYGAQKAGLEPGDVIVGINDEKVDRVKTLMRILSQFNAGDRIEIEAYRGQEKMHFSLDTMAQKIQTLPESPEELAKELEARGSQMLEKLEQVLEGVTDAEASYSPGPDEWSAKETLVHLIHSERENHIWINDLVGGQERIYDEWPGNQLFRIRATLTTYPTINDLLAELRRSLKETVASIAFLDQSFTRRRASYWRLGTEILNGTKHIEEHIHQIKDNIRTARSVFSA